MDRPTLPADKVSSAARDVVAGFHRAIVDEAVAGMAQNPVVKRARKLLDAEGVKFTYIEHGSYFSKWKERLAIKLWAGFPTFPMVFVDGTLIGGNAELQKARESGKLTK